METKGMIYGFLGVLGFSLTLPASRFAVPVFGPTVVGPGRALMAALIAGVVLWVRRERIPNGRQWWGLCNVAFGAVLAFPYLSAWAMDRLPASHGAVELALLPLATAGASAFRNGERPSLAFWAASFVGAGTVCAYAVLSGLGGVHLADLAFLAAVVIVAIAYAEGGRLAGQLGGWQVIAWALVLASPVVIVLLLFGFPNSVVTAPASAWAALVYLGIGSQFLAFVAWYTGLAMGGVARVSQMQYLQPFLTIVFSSIFLGEHLTLKTVAASLLVVIVVALGKRTTIRKVS